MRFITYRDGSGTGIGVVTQSGEYRGMAQSNPGFPGHLQQLIAAGPDAMAGAYAQLRESELLDEAAISFLPPLSSPGKIICVGLNYADHIAESGLKQPDYPTLFARFSSSLIGHRAPIIRPHLSDQLDYEGEFVVVIGKRGRHIAYADALDHVAGYSIFNEASLRDFQFKAAQWTSGKNFDGTGAFGPSFVTADELPPGAKGLRLKTRLNGEIMQNALVDDMVFNVQTLICATTEAMTLEPGDLIVTGTPGGVGAVRKPPVWLKPGDVCEIEVEGLGTLSNPVADEALD